MTNDVKKAHYVEAEDLWITPKGRGVFVFLSKPWKDKFAASIIIPPEFDLKPLKAAVNELAKSLAPGKKDFDLFKPGKTDGVKSPFLRADEFYSDVTSKGEPVDLDGYVLIRPTSNIRQKVRLADGSLVDEDELELETASGRWMRLMVKPFAYNKEGNRGVSLGLNGVQLLGKDDRIGAGSGTSTGEAFGAVDDEDDDDI